MLLFMNNITCVVFMKIFRVFVTDYCPYYLEFSNNSYLRLAACGLRVLKREFVCTSFSLSTVVYVCLGVYVALSVQVPIHFTIFIFHFPNDLVKLILFLAL